MTAKTEEIVAEENTRLKQLITKLVSRAATMHTKHDGRTSIKVIILPDEQDYHQMLFYADKE